MSDHLLIIYLLLYRVLIRVITWSERPGILEWVKRVGKEKIRGMEMDSASRNGLDIEIGNRN